MKRILFVVIHADIGGIEKAFFNLLKELAKAKRYEVDIVMFCQNGVLLDELPEKFKLYPSHPMLRLIGISQREAWREGFRTGATRLLLGGITKYVSRNLGYKLVMSGVKRLSGYDAAISFMHGKTGSFYGGTNEFVLNKVRAKKYYTFIHGDIKMAKLDTFFNRQLYKRFDKIANVSESCKRLLVETWPEFAEKACVVENCCDTEGIRRLADEKIKYIRAGMNFVTVARLDRVKAIVRTIKVFSQIKARYDDFIWHIVGEGKERTHIEHAIKEYGMEGYIVLHGAKKNPYPYMKHSDALLLVSYQEAAPLVYQEAHILRVPVLTTNTRSAEEMVEETKTGIVCENSEEGIYHMLLCVFRNPDVLEKIRRNMPEKNNKRAVEQFISMIEGDGHADYLI